MNFFKTSRLNKFYSPSLINKSFFKPKVFRRNMCASESTPPISKKFSKTKVGSFFQSPPSITNIFLEDVTLISYLKRIIPVQTFEKIEPDLQRFGLRAVTEVDILGRQCEKVQPSVKHFDEWGRRIDEIVTSDSWKKLKCIAAEEGLIAHGYQRQHGEWSRLYQLSKIYMFASYSGLFSCPLAMTDGAAKILENLNSNEKEIKVFYDHLTSTEPDYFWTSGQWMTERRGGSDVANGTETLAVEQPDGTHKLYGYKWFTSATDSEISLALARSIDESSQPIPGTRGLSLYLVKIRDSTGKLNNIEITRLKDKLGTRQLPTAELLLDGTVATKISEEGRGVACISSMLMMTRIHNALSSVSVMRRIVNLAKDFSKKRSCFNNTIKDYPLHAKHIVNMEIQTRAALLLTLELARILGHQELSLASKQDLDLLRLFTPICKLYTAKQAVSVVSEGLECFGGVGYLEDSGLPCLLRDAQVLPIWEGTTNILSLDTLRAIEKSDGSVLLSFYESVHQRLDSLNVPQELKDSVTKVEQCCTKLLDFNKTHRDLLEVSAREFSYSLARTLMGTLLIEHACSSSGTKQDIFIAKSWCSQDLTPVINEQTNNSYDKESIKMEYEILFGDDVSSINSKL